MATCHHILPCGLKIVGVPRVGYIAGMTGVVQQQMYLAIWVTTADAVHIPEVCLIHADEQVEFLVIAFGKLPRRVAAAGNPVLCQLAPCRRIGGVAYLLAAGGGRLYMELSRQPRFFY